jgi:hypothetical protein
MENMPSCMSCYSPAAVHPAKPNPGGDRTCSRGPCPSLTNPLAPLRQWLPCLMALLFMLVTFKALAATPPELHTEVQLSDTRPYAQQTVILRLHISHSPAVTGLEVNPVQAPDFRLKLLAGPPRTTRLSGPQQMSSDFVYALTPLSSGTLRLPPLVVQARKESTAAPDTQPASIEISSSSEPLSLEVQALPDDATSLLPLYALDVTLQHVTRAPLKVGEPFEVRVVQHATGGAGERLSNAMALLKSNDFRVYPGRSSTSSRPMRNGQLLEGQRIDTLTLVPLHGGQLRLPSLSLPWWDVGHARVVQASWPGESVEVWPESLETPTPAAGAPHPATAGAGSRPVSLWFMIIGLVVAFACGWWMRGRGVNGNTGRVVKPFGSFSLPLRPKWWAVAAWRHAANLGSRFSSFLHREERFIARISARLPNPWAIAHETDHLRKDLESARDADVVRQCLLGWGNKVLGLPLHATLTEWGQAVRQAYPQVDGSSLDHLLAALDASLYGGTRGLELEAWKRAFRTELDRVGRRKPFHAVPARERGLPALNPG